MERRRAAAGAIVVRRLVDRFFSENGGDGSGVRRFVDVWTRVRTSIPAHAVRAPRARCLSAWRAGWDGECEGLLAYAVAHRLALPMPTTVVFLEQLAGRGELARVAMLGGHARRGRRGRHLPHDGIAVDCVWT
ncbi:hypothetical protein PINS_up017846 [Pythium insidiosum]|nr:hypothetical protein PINS_up017846 [Pythium insidiosum]